MVKRRFCGWKNSLELHVVDGQFPMGVPRDDVSTVLELEEMSLGTLARGKNHTLQC